MASNDQINRWPKWNKFPQGVLYWVVCNVHGSSLKRDLDPFFNCPTTPATDLTIQVSKILKSPPCLAHCIRSLSLSNLPYQIGNQPAKKQLPKTPWTFNVLVLRRSPAFSDATSLHRFVVVSSCAVAPRLLAIPGAVVLPPPGALRTDPGSLMVLHLEGWGVWRYRLCQVRVYYFFVYSTLLYTYMCVCVCVLVIHKQNLLMLVDKFFPCERNT